MRDKAVNTYPSTINVDPKYFLTDEICDKAVNICFFVFDSIPDWCKIQEMYDKLVSDNPLRKLLMIL